MQTGVHAGEEVRATEEQDTVEQKPVLSGFVLALVLVLVGLCALGMLVLAAAAVVFR
jgi:hypothetical protein